MLVVEPFWLRRLLLPFGCISLCGMGRPWSSVVEPFWLRWLLLPFGCISLCGMGRPWSSVGWRSVFGCRLWNLLPLLPIRGEPGAPPILLSCVMLLCNLLCKKNALLCNASTHCHFNLICLQRTMACVDPAISCARFIPARRMHLQPYPHHTEAFQARPDTPSTPVPSVPRRPHGKFFLGS